MKDKILKETLNANGTSITIISDVNTNNEYISLTDIAKYKNSEFPKDLIIDYHKNSKGSNSTPLNFLNKQIPKSLILEIELVIFSSILKSIFKLDMKLYA